MKPVTYGGQDLSSGVVVLRFTAEWCGPCKPYGILFDAVMSERPEPAYIIDIDESPDLAAIHKVMSLPTTVVLKNGSTIHGLSGILSGPKLKELLDDA